MPLPRTWTTVVAVPRSMAMSCELNLNQREKRDIDTASCHRSRAPDGHAPVVIYRRARPATATIRGRFRLFLLGWLDKMIRAVRMGRDLRSTALGQRPCQYVACRKSRSEEHTSELQSLMRISYAVFCLKKK